MLKTLFFRHGEYYKSPFDRLKIRPSVRMLETDFRFFFFRILGVKQLNFFAVRDRALGLRHFLCALARRVQGCWPFENPAIRSDFTDGFPVLFFQIEI